MRLVARKWKFVCVLLTLILSGSLSTGVAFADDESKTVPARDEQPKTLGTAKTETIGQSGSTATETSAPQEENRRALPAPLDPLFPGSEYLGPTPLIGVPDTDPEYPRSGLLEHFLSLPKTSLQIPASGFPIVDGKIRF